MRAVAVAHAPPCTPARPSPRLALAANQTRGAARNLIGREEPTQHHLIQHPASKHAHNEGKQKTKRAKKKEKKERKEKEAREGRKRNDVVDKKVRF